MNKENKKFERPKQSLTGNEHYFSEREVRSIFRKITYYTPKSILRRFAARHLPLFIREGIPFLGERRKWLLWVILILAFVLFAAVKELLHY